MLITKDSYNFGGLYVKSGKGEKSFLKYYWPLLQGIENRKVSHASPTQSALGRHFRMSVQVSRGH